PIMMGLRDLAAVAMLLRLPALTGGSDCDHLEDLALTRPVAHFNLTGVGTPARLQGASTTFNLPRVLGTPPMLGRESLTAEPSLVDQALWRR
ncbi:MAG TPA: hypothetical protein VER03_06140, partial [Bryobacteraceae bacterium]|nr:hypothetical protein [Bryobacteraceae bacterium]